MIRPLSLPLSARRSIRSRRWRESGFFRPIGEELEARTVLSGAQSYDEVAADWFQRVSPGILGYAPQTFVGPIAPAMGTSSGNWQSTADVAQWIVRLTPDATQLAGSVAGADGLLNGNSNAFHVLRGLGLPGLVLVEANISTEATRAALASNSSVATFEVNAYFFTQATPNDPDFPSLTGLDNVGQFGATADADIDAREAWDVDTGSTNIVVGVIDSGIDYTHPDLYLNVWINQGEIPTALKSQLVDTDTDGRITFYDLNNPANASRVRDLNNNTFIDAGDLYADPRWTDGVDTDRNAFVDDLFGWNFRSATDEPNAPNDPQDILGHGTHVAGTIGAIGNNSRGVTGINWRTSLMALKFLDTGNSGQTADAVAAINYATMMREQFGEPIKVLNASWGQSGSESQALRDAIAAAGQADMLLVAAAGNGNILGQGINLDRDPFFPATSDLANVISVAASGPTDELARFSNFGKVAVDLAAPGIGVLSTLPGGRYGTANGTSMAAPHVAGVAALVWSELPFATANEVRQAILTTVDTKPDFTTVTSTGGRLNALRAINSNVFAPRASVVSAANPVVTVAGGADNLITIKYHDRQGINDTTIGDGDIIATRQWGPADTISATYVANSKVISNGGTDVTAQYRIAAPGGSWDPLDYGGYELSAVAGQVKNASGLPVPIDPFGKFSVRIADSAVFYVNSFVDAIDHNVGDGLCATASGDCSIRGAIQETNAAAPLARTIILDQGVFTLAIPPEPSPTSDFPDPAFLFGCFDGLSTFTLSDVRSGDLDVVGNATLYGSFTESTTIDGKQLDRVFKVHPGGRLGLNRVTVSGGAAQYGGGILSAGIVDIDRSTVAANTAAGSGGGIAVWGGTADILQSTIRGNSAVRGGGILVCNDGTVQIDGCTLMKNAVSGNGSALLASFAGEVQIANSTISGNRAQSGAVVSSNPLSFSGSDQPSISADGRFIAFSTYSPELVSGDMNGGSDIFGIGSDVLVYDRMNGRFERISVADDGTQANNESYSPDISADGRYVAFASAASNLVPDDTNRLLRSQFFQAIYSADVFVFDRLSKRIERVSVRNDGGQSNNHSHSPTISSDGRLIAFVSEADNLVSGDSNNVDDIFVFDRQTRTIERITQNGVQFVGDSDSPSLSADGRYVIFSSKQSASSTSADIFLYDRNTRVTELVTVGFDGFPGNGNSETPAISDDGRFVTFASSATNLVAGDTNAVADVFVFDRQSHTMKRVSVSAAGFQGNKKSDSPAISGDGHIVTFASDATNLVVGDSNGVVDVFAYDRQMQNIERISIADDGTQGDFRSSMPSVSADGRILTFASNASNLLPDGALAPFASFPEIYAVDRILDHMEPVTPTPNNAAVVLDSSTVAYNIGFSTINGYKIQLHNSLFASNSASSAEQMYLLEGDSLGHNLFDRYVQESLAVLTAVENGGAGQLSRRLKMAARMG